MTTPGIPCGCAAEKWAKGVVCCINNEESTQGLFVYAGRSEHSKPWKHYVKLVDLETMETLTVHLHCKDVYMPFPDPWPWFIGPEEMRKYEKEKAELNDAYKER